MRLLNALKNAVWAIAAYVTIVVIASVAADYTYFRQMRAEHQSVAADHLNSGD